MGVCFSKSSNSVIDRHYASDAEHSVHSTEHSEAESRTTSPPRSPSGQLSDLSGKSPAWRGNQPPRRALLGDLAAIRSSLEGIQDMKAVPDSSVLDLDAALLPVTARSENIRSADKCRNAGAYHFPLHHFPHLRAFCAAIADDTLQDGRAIFRLKADHDHVVSADVRTVGPAVSILILEPVDQFSVRRLLESCLEEMAGLLPSNAAVSVLIHDSQKSKFDCAIFALHAASKMVDERRFLDALHAEHASPHGPGYASRLAHLRHTQVGSYRIVDAHTILPPAFYKHGQSRKAIEKAFANRGGAQYATVNKQGQTLLGRFEDKRDFRLDLNATVSTSIEDKRIAYLARARDYLHTAPEDEVHDTVAAVADTAPDWFRKSRAAIDADTDS
ncbi:YopJ family acetyltransferase [Ralstonia pseudosolanacearum]|uniref:YopJ family acetyltransferase n=1 Tax=Ralstonia pseudosolanacearum TaxID=1310165 RepID=UPI0012691E72|nr:YopJ family acetyltransferase [Ralstonia pseudosolanacearum]MDO3578264.1 YopJ family acetyltransferase [Ralstonia pseudosolanacearum]MDO3587556.1 YopJ family acetyltransferase [Ralstonia pseudosolanacearum]